MKGGAKKNKETENRFESLLQRIEKQYNPPEQQEHALSFLYYQRPPDEAASALGQQLAVTFQDLSLELVPSMQEKALVCLTSPHMNPSIIQGFLTTLWTTSTSWTGMDWLPSWILHTDKLCCSEYDDDDDERTNWDALTAMIHCHAKCVRRHLQRPDTNQIEMSHEIAVSFRKLQSSPSQIAMLREFTKVAFYIPENEDETNVEHGSLHSVRPMLSPLMTTTVLSLKKRPQHQTVLFLEGLWREAWNAIPIALEQGLQAEVMDVLEWMAKSLGLYLSSISCCSRSADKIGGKEIAHRWLIQLLEMATFLEPSLDSESIELQMLSKWLSRMVTGPLICICATIPTFRISLQPVLLPIQAIIQRLNSTKTCRFTLDTIETHKLAAMLLSNPLQEDVRELILVLAASISTNSGGTSSSMVESMLRGVGSMLVANSNYSSSCAELIRSLPNRSSRHIGTKTARSTYPMNSLLQIVEEELTEDVKSLIDFLATEGFSLNAQQLSATQQMGALLFGVGLLDSDASWNESTRGYFHHLLLKYPHLGVPLLPIVIESINRACIRGDGAFLIDRLDFLCDTIIQDPQCAREVWNLLGVQLMQPTVSVAIRASVIRLFPKICASNKRLYKRVIVALGNSLVFNKVAPGPQDINDQNEIKLAVAATVAELARDDLIKDVTDIIGWIQDFIEDCGWVRSVSTLDKEVSTAKAAIVHYALLCLHYLVVSQELDYNVVMVVLRKRLCDVHNLEEVTKLPPLVLEALAILLGDGECDDDESDSDDGREQRVGIHPQVRQSVTTLIQLGLSETLHPNEKDVNSLARQVLSKCRENLYASLSRYSLDALGLDDGGIIAACSAASNPDTPAMSESGRQYNALKLVIEKGIQRLQADGEMMMQKGRFEGYKSDGQKSESLQGLTSKILKFEEDILGSSLWQKRSKAKKRNKSEPSESLDKSSYIAALPSSETIRELYNENRGTATALSALLCDDDKPMSNITMLAMDICNESSDALINVMYVQAWLHTSRSLLQQLVASQSSSEGLQNIFNSIREWRYTHDNADNMNMALSALALHIPVVLGPYGDHSIYVGELCDEVYMAYQDHGFENPDVAKLCLAFVAVCSVRNNDFSRVTEVVEALEKSVTAYGGKVSFGACFGLASIAQAFCGAEGDTSDGTAARFIRRITGFLLRQLLSCIKGNYPALQRLLVSVENGSIDPEVIDALTALRRQQLVVVESKRGIAKIIFMAFGLCSRAFAIVNDELLLGIYCFLGCLPWGSGKGFALPSILRTCLRCGLFQDSEVQKIYANYARIFQDGLDNGVRGLDDILYVVTATNAKVIPHSTRRFLVGNPSLFDNDGRCVSLLCAVCSLSSLPCLGHNSELFTDSPQLLSFTTKSDIVGVSSLIMEALGASDFDLGKYSQIGVLLMGYLASLKTFIGSSDLSVAGSSTLHTSKESRVSQLPTPHKGTVLEVLMSFLSPHVFESRNEVVANDGTCGLVGCLEVLSLPGHFAVFNEKILGRDALIAEVSTKLLVSQLEGRPRAVFDGREFIDQAIKLIKTPSDQLRESIIMSTSPLLLESLDTILSKLPTERVHDAMDTIWQMCLSETEGSSWALSFLDATKRILIRGNEVRTFNIAPNKLRIVQTFLLRSAFEGLRNTKWTTRSQLAERAIVKLYAHCLAEIPINSLVEVEFFTLTDHDGFVGEALRYRCIMILVRLDYFESASRVSSEIQAAMSWFSRQLVSSLDSTFSNSLLSICCSMMDATELENSDGRKSLLFMLLDNLMLVGAQASMMGLQMLGALVGQWTRGRGSDGDLSLACLCIRPQTTWQSMPPRTALKLLEILVRDMPYNLASFTKKERIKDAVSNRLHRIHSRWLEYDVSENSLMCLRQAVALCRSEESENNDFDYMGNTMLQKQQQ
ncbi:unnamed protein product [Cylindrotheca closterium]|uniref:Uncharacterized protein n=1 Tax=Cylindrotheca closterium TaxID=2856 RepID=A0AAD2FQN9_9STRA|nr:unnamed protein product [Cylindrotheca closterium]